MWSISCVEQCIVYSSLMCGAVHSVLQPGGVTLTTVILTILVLTHGTRMGQQKSSLFSVLRLHEDTEQAEFNTQMTTTELKWLLHVFVLFPHCFWVPCILSHFFVTFSTCFYKDEDDFFSYIIAATQWLSAFCILKPTIGSITSSLDTAVQQDTNFSASVRDEFKHQSYE